MTAQREDGDEKDSVEAAAVDGRVWKKKNLNFYAIDNGRTPHGLLESKHKSFLHLRSSLSREISSLKAMNLHPSEELEDETHVHALMNNYEHAMNSWLLLINDLTIHKKRNGQLNGSHKNRRQIKNTPTTTTTTIKKAKRRGKKGRNHSAKKLLDTERQTALHW